MPRSTGRQRGTLHTTQIRQDKAPEERRAPQADPQESTGKEKQRNIKVTTEVSTRTYSKTGRLLLAQAVTFGTRKREKNFHFMPRIVVPRMESGLDEENVIFPSNVRLETMQQKKREGIETLKQGSRKIRQSPNGEINWQGGKGDREEEGRCTQTRSTEIENIPEKKKIQKQSRKATSRRYTTEPTESRQRKLNYNKRKHLSIFRQTPGKRSEHFALIKMNNMRRGDKVFGSGEQIPPECKKETAPKG